MTNGEAVNWIINISADIGKAKHRDLWHYEQALSEIREMLESAQPERLTDDDFETIRIHLNAFKENLCNQRRWKEAEEYQRIIDRFMAFASAQPRKGKWIKGRDGIYHCSCCGTEYLMYDAVVQDTHYCPNCGSYNGGEQTG